MKFYEGRVLLGKMSYESLLSDMSLSGEEVFDLLEFLHWAECRRFIARPVTEPLPSLWLRLLVTKDSCKHG